MCFCICDDSFFDEVLFHVNTNIHILIAKFSKHWPYSERRSVGSKKSVIGGKQTFYQNLLILIRNAQFSYIILSKSILKL